MFSQRVSEKGFEKQFLNGFLGRKNPFKNLKYSSKKFFQTNFKIIFICNYFQLFFKFI